MLLLQGILLKNDWGEEKWLRAKEWKIGKIVIDSKGSVEEKKSARKGAKIGERVQERVQR